jgi:MoxR-like ATPase
MNNETKTAVAAFEAARGEVAATLVERRVEVELSFACLIARVHPLWIGPSGVAKSMLVDQMLERITGDVRKFTRLLAKGSTPEEVLGPPNLMALTEGRWERVIDGKLPTAHVAFIDEIFKSNSALLNALLKIVNERVFENDGSVIHVPLWVMFGASNELPGHDRDDLRAFRDRFGICKIVEPVRTENGRRDVLDGQLKRLAVVEGASEPKTVTREQVELLQQAVANVSVSEKLRKAVTDLQGRAQAEGLQVSGRRIFEGLRVAMARAVMRGDSALRAEDLTVMQHVLWTDPEDIGLAYELTLDYAGQSAKAAAKIRSEFEPISTSLDELRAKIPTDGSAPEDEVANAVAGLQMKLKAVNARVMKEVNRANEDGEPDEDLQAIRVEIEQARRYIREDVLGMGGVD